MNANKIRVAITSSNGEFIDLHFGKCEAFEIIDIDKNAAKYECIEIRISPRMCLEGGHNPETLKNIIMLLSDCKYIITARIGIWIVSQLKENGIIPVEFFGHVEEALRIIRDEK
jgi:predicted Fe-Mo cluster-binding NifX family protein